jgi:hypothetical protein
MCVDEDPLEERTMTISAAYNDAMKKHPQAARLRPYRMLVSAVTFTIRHDLNCLAKVPPNTAWPQTEQSNDDGVRIKTKSITQHLEY